MRHPPRWTIADIIDFEHLITTEDRAGGTARSDAAAQIFCTEIAPKLTAAQRDDRRTVFRQWLEIRRRDEAGDLPGESFSAGWQMLLIIALLMGLLLGGAVPGALMATGDSVNALLFFGCTVGIQLAILVGGFLLWSLRHWLSGILGGFHPLRACLGGFLARLGLALRGLPPEKRLQMGAALGILERRREIYGSLALWPVLIVTQLFAVAFNVAVLAVMLLVQLALVDRSFHWESTYDSAPKNVERIVTFMAKPWSWAIPHAAPNAAEIAATHRRRGVPAAAADLAANRHAWWPFLACSVAFYGLLPRLLLLLYASRSLRSKLTALPFRHAEANALWRRLSGPLVASGPSGARLPELLGSGAAAETAPVRRTGECIVLAAQELPLDAAATRSLVAGQYPWPVRSVHAARVDQRKDSAPLFANLAAAQNNLAAIIVIIPAERDPIVAIALFIQALEKAIGSDVELLVLLVGAPLPEGGFAPVPADRLHIWKMFRDLRALRPGIEVLP